MTAGEFVAACSAFARRHPAAVLEMPAPELAVDHHAPAHHVRRTCLDARRRMQTTAKLTLKTAAIAPGPDLFTQPEHESLTA